ncbi:MAG: sulfatase [Microscillaceae bacterium]|nr:sulfatase [Microscillaceae bacterium]
MKLIWLGLVLGAMNLAWGQNSKPNVLLIIVDDLRPELGCYGKSQMHTPNIDQLAKEGILFRQAYCQQAVCSPSRTSLLTGKRPETTKISGNDDHFRQFIPEVVTLPQYFKKNGYHTQSVGKIYHTNLDDPLSWSVPSWMPPPARYGKPETNASIEKEKKRLQAEGKAYQEIITYDSLTKTPLHVKQVGIEVKGPSWEDPEVADTVLRDGKTMKKALEILQNLKHQSQPFFLAVGLSNPHLPFAAPKKYFDLYPYESIRLPQNFHPPLDAPDYAYLNGGDLYRYADIEGRYKVSPQKAKELIRGYYAATSYSDAMIGLIINELQKLGLKENTLIVLIGDHGYHLGENGAWCKQTNFEIATRSPFIIVPSTNYALAGAKCEAMVEFVDIYPTLADLAGLAAPTGCEGYSLKKLIDKPDLAWKSAVFSQYPRRVEQKRLMGYSMRTPQYRYTEWKDQKSGKIESRELYNHSIDPEENKNLALSPDYQMIINQLSKQLQLGWQKALPKNESRK